MIDLRPYSDLDAHAVMQRLDPHDRIELELVRGTSMASALTPFAEWRAIMAVAAVGYIAQSRGRPFALFCLVPTGTAGVAQGALVARDHDRFRRPLAELAIGIRNRMPAECRRIGIRRVEARCWVGHPTASRLLQALGFRAECVMPGFGPMGRDVFAQFAWIDPATTTDCLIPRETEDETNVLCP